MVANTATTHHRLMRWTNPIYIPLSEYDDDRGQQTLCAVIDEVTRT